MTTPSVLFVCTANRYRSPLAAAIFERLLPPRVTVTGEWHIGSAGTWVKKKLPALPDAIRRGEGLGVYLTAHMSREVSEEMLSEFDLISVMEAGQKEALTLEFPNTQGRVFLLSEIVDGVLYDIPDPAKSVGEEEQIVGILVELLERGYEQICQLALEINERR